MQSLFLRPVMPVYFGRPGALPAGEARSGASWFPPPISAFQGMIRTRLLDEAGVFSPRSRVTELVGSPDRLPLDWQLQGPFPVQAREKGTMEIWLPVPAFVMKPKGWQSKKEPVFAWRLGAGVGGADLFLTDDRGQPFEPLGNTGAGAEKPLPGWVSSENLWQLLCGNSYKWQAGGYGTELPPFVRYEDKIGLAREKEIRNEGLYLSGRPREGMLYSLRTLRFKDGSGLVGWFDGPLKAPLRLALTRGRVVAGKKGGSMVFERMPGSEDQYWEKIVAGDHLNQNRNRANGKLFWITLLTPGRWLDDGEGTAAGMLARAAGFQDVRVLGMICPAITWLGGFSLAVRRPRPAVSWFSPGTSLLVQIRDAVPDVNRIVRTAWNNRCVLTPDDKCFFGYGHILASHYYEPGEK